jgi:hypothetical protein
MNTRIAFVALLLIALCFGGYLIMSPGNKTNESTQQPINSPSSSPSNSPSTLSPDSKMVNDLQMGGSSYSDPQGVYQFLYPSEYKIDSENNGQHTRIYKTGPTQRGQTEMYDGVIIVFESHNLNGKSLEILVDENIKTSTADGTSELTSPKQNITINSQQGFTYKMRGLGEATYFAIQKDKNSDYALVVTTSISDPTNVGFQKEVDALLSTIRMLK